MPEATEKVVVELIARANGFDVRMKQSADGFDKAMQRIFGSATRAEGGVVKSTRNQAKAVKNLETQMRSSSSAISRQIKSLAAGFAAYFTGRELIGLLDSFTRLQNNLRVAGLEGERLASVQADLLGLSQKYGVEIESLSGVFLKASLVQKELGASTQQIIDLNEIIAASLKVTGTSAQQAQGALLQLGQALGSGVVRAEEFNSILEGALPLAQAAARGIDGMNGSVAKLRQEIVAGNITSRQFFEGVLKGGVQTLADAEKATLTLSGGFTALKSALTVYFGEADKANGVSAALGEALQGVAENLDVLIPALAAVGIALGVGTVTNAIAAQVALNGVAASATRAGSALLAAFGGPVGVAITAVTGALLYTASVSRDAEAAMKANADAAELLAAELGNLEDAADGAGGETEGVGTAASQSEPKIWSFANSVDGLTESLWQQAKAARAARVETLKNRELELEGRVQDQLLNTTRGQVEQIAQGGGKLKEGDVLGGVEDVLRGSLRRLNNFFRGGKPAEQAEQIIADAQKNRDLNNQLLQEALSDPIGADDLIGRSPPTDTPAKKRKGPTAEEIEQDHQREMSRLRQEEIRATLDITEGIKARAELFKKSLAEERDARLAEIENDKNFTPEQKEAQRAIIDALYGQAAVIDKKTGEILSQETPGLLQTAIDRDTQKRLAEQSLDIAQSKYEAERDSLDIEYDLARTQGDKKKIAFKILDAQEEYLNAVYDTILATEAEGSAKWESARIAKAALAAQSAGRREIADRQNQTPLESYLDQIPQTAREIDEALQAVAAGGLRAFEDGLVDAIVNFKSLGDVARAVLREITAALVRLVVQQLILKAFGSLVPGLSTGGAVQGKASGGAIQGFASGGRMKFPTGGHITGPGNGVSDSILAFGPNRPIKVSNGEYLIRADSARKIGRAALDRMNLTGELPYGYASGGSIGFAGPRNASAGKSDGLASLDDRSINRLAQIVANAAGAMPEVKLFPTLDPAAALRASLSSPGGQRAMFDFIADNSQRFRSAVES